MATTDVSHLFVVTKLCVDVVVLSRPFVVGIHGGWRGLLTDVNVQFSSACLYLRLWGGATTARAVGLMRSETHRQMYLNGASRLCACIDSSYTWHLHINMPTQGHV